MLPHFLGLSTAARIERFIVGILILSICTGFNLDIHAPIYKYGPNGSYFGYSVAEHFKINKPVLLVGAPRAESGQVGTERAGALFACPINTYYSTGGSEWCDQVKSEYEDVLAYGKTPDMTGMGREVHYLGKNGELLGASLASQGTEKGGAVNTMVTGLIGAMKWTGGVFARRSEGGIFGTQTEKYTMAPEDGGIRSMLTAHDYLGYSVGVGRFGFWHENGDKATVVSGATRFGQHGAVVFLPFTKVWFIFILFMHIKSKFILVFLLKWRSLSGEIRQKELILLISTRTLMTILYFFDNFKPFIIFLNISV
uniref:FAD_binding_2 domain-containing protein n=1 Tax=Heterorhabditis bacteriophora TaxID=37862 RepID=A0A1I7XAY1_HETBA